MNGALHWRALAAGTGFNVGISLLISFGGGFLFGLFDPSHFAVASFVLRLGSALADIGGGAIAGYIARRDGLLHGGITSLAATALLVPISLLRIAWMSRGGAEVHLGASYWIDFGLWTAVGLFLAAVAGFLAVELRKPRA